MTKRTVALVALFLAACLWTPAAAGPPAICHPLEIGQAKSLPWGSKAFSKDRRYRTSGVVQDTLRILTQQPDALVHMETLRRAAIYTDRDRDKATELLTALMTRTLDSEAGGKPDGLAWFDAGYLAHCYDELGVSLAVRCSTERGVVGYGWVRRGIELAGDDAAMEFGAALITVMAGIPEHHEHAARARKLAPGGSLVSKNLEHHASAYWRRHRPVGSG